MNRVKLSDFFRDDYLCVVNSHKKRLQEILNNYEIAIFMARKAICFFDALMENNELCPTNCHVISSRVIDYDNLERFKGRKVAVIDDVVVKGVSINCVAEKLSEHGVLADYYVIACEESFGHRFVQQFPSLNKDYSYYTQLDIYKLSGLITQYIEASMRTFNVDSPVFNITNNLHFIKKILIENGSINITSGLQKKYGIINRVLFFKVSGDKCDNPILKVLENAILKIRFYYNDKKVIAVPFVLLPEGSLSTLNILYNLIHNYDIDSLVHCDNENIQNENKFKVTSYLLAKAFFCSFVKKYGIDYYENEYYDTIQFDAPIGRLISHRQFDSLCEIFTNSKVINVTFSQFDYSNHIQSAYKYIASINPENQPYTDWKGELIGKRESVETERLSRIVFSFNDLYKGINTIQSEEKTAYFSCAIDTLIDKGFIVPSIVHNKSLILRAYKMGEFSKLTKEQLQSFLKMIYIYQSYLNRDLDRTEFEKLCVLFFRMQIYNHNFGEETEFDEDCYSVGYTYYGPRISNSRDLYTVSNDSALVTDFVDKNYVKNQDGKYHVVFQPEIEDFRLNYSCDIFALDFVSLFNVFKDHPYEKSCNPWNQYIHTYDQYLTILAVGENRKNQILSLCAEICQLVYLREEMFFDELEHLPVERYKRILSGVNSGLWKYRCYKEDAFKRTTEKIAEYGGTSALRGISAVQTTYDQREKNVELRDEIGEFLYKAAYVINELLIICGRIGDFKFSFFDDADKPVSKAKETIFSTSEFYYRKQTKTSVDTEISNAVDIYGTEKSIKKFFNSIIREARYMLDKCDMYLEHNSPYLELVKEFIVAYSPSGVLPNNFRISTECVVSNLTESSKIAVFSINGECDRNSIVDNLIIDTQDIGDCIYLLVSSLVNNDEGYVQFDNFAKGTCISRKVKELLKTIEKLPDKKQRLFVLRQSQNDKLFVSFNASKVKMLRKAVLSSNNYSLDIYLIEREKTMDNKDMLNFNVNVHNNNGSLVFGKNIKQENNNIITGEIVDLIQDVLTAAKDLPLDEQEEIKEYINVIQSEVTSKKPQKSMLKTALEGLKRFVTSEKFIDAVAKLAPIVMNFIHMKALD